MKIGATWVVTFLIACTCAAAPKPAPGPAVATEQAPKSTSTIDFCGAGHLPHVTEKSLVDGGLTTFLANAAKGTVAVDWNGSSARVVDRCHLDGAYVEAKGNGKWRFRATNRVLFRTDEIAGECRKATHLVAAYIFRNDHQAGPDNVQINGILVPLPCPPANDPEPATGCIARGLTGPARRKTADALMNDLSPGHVNGADPAKVLEIFALIPDKHWGLRYGIGVNAGDCSLQGQAHWLGSQYMWHGTDDMADDPNIVELLDASRRQPPPRLDWHCSDFNCSCKPVFLQCFPGQFDPIFGGPGFWTPVEPGQK